MIWAKQVEMYSRIQTLWICLRRKTQKFQRPSKSVCNFKFPTTSNSNMAGVRQ